VMAGRKAALMQLGRAGCYGCQRTYVSCPKAPSVFTPYDLIRPNGNVPVFGWLSYWSRELEQLKLPATYPKLVPRKAAPRMGGSPIILVVEDEWLVRDAIVRSFRIAGWEVLHASSGEAAIALLQSGRHFDALFTDIQLRGSISGWDVADFTVKHPNAAVTYASGNAIDRYRQVPVSRFFSKPYEADAIVDACRLSLRDE
jgi:CheY-like chemotaxis protein